MSKSRLASYPALIDTQGKSMPVALERKLKRQASDKGLSKKRKDAYVYGTLRKTGWKPSREKKMNDPSEAIEFGIGEGLGKLWGKTRWGKAQAWEKEYKTWKASQQPKVQPHIEGYLTAGNGNYIKDSGAGPLRQSGWNREFTRKSMFSSKDPKYKMNNPSEPIEFASLPSYWAKGALKSGLKPDPNTIRIQLPTAVDKFRLSQLGGGIKKPTVSMPTKSYYPGPNAKSDFLNERGSRAQSSILTNLTKSYGWSGYSSTDKLVRLAQIDNQIDSIVRFDDDDDDRRGHPLLKTGAAAGVGTAGLYGYGLARRGVNPGKFGGGLYKAAGTDVRNIGSAMAGGRLPTAAVGDIGKSIAAGGRGVMQGAKLGASKLAGLLGKLRGLSSKEPLVQFDEHILEPFGAQEKSKIAQEQFPAGLSPAAALRMPFPELMRFLKQRNILQQQFSKVEKLIEIDSKMDQLIQFADLTGKSNWKGQSPETNLRRGAGMGFLAGGPYGAVAGGIAAGAYGKRGVIYKKRDPWGHGLEGGLGGVAGGTAGQLLGAIGGERGAIIGRGLGTIGGYVGGYGLGAHHTLKKRQAELKRGQIFSAKMQRLIQLDSGLDDLIEFEFTDKAKKKFEEVKGKIKAKFQKKKGHKSHGGGT